jgi:putative membrane protein
MRRRMLKLFTPHDAERIKAAVEQAEKNTSGEIVAYVVERSDAYEEAEWRLGALLATLLLALLLVLHYFTTIWLALDLSEMALVVLSAFALGIALAAFSHPLKRFFAGRHLLDRRVRQRATEAFLSEEVFRTRDRTGILIFVSLLEHRVLVLGDTGISAKVEQSEWHDIVQAVTRAIRAGKPADGLVDAVTRAGALLERHGLPRKADDRDELSDRLRIKER